MFLLLLNESAYLIGLVSFLTSFLRFYILNKQQQFNITYHVQYFSPPPPSLLPWFPHHAVQNYDRFPRLIINSNSPPPLALFVRIYRAIGLEMLASYWLPLQPISVGLGLPPLFHIPSVATKPTGLLPAAA